MISGISTNQTAVHFKSLVKPQQIAFCDVHFTDGDQQKVEDSAFYKVAEAALKALYSASGPIMSISQKIMPESVTKKLQNFFLSLGIPVIVKLDRPVGELIQQATEEANAKIKAEEGK